MKKKFHHRLTTILWETRFGKKDGPTYWAKRRGFSHSDHISAGFELLDFGPKSKDNSWSYIQIFHSVYIEDRKKVVWQWERTIAAQLMFGDAICPCCIGEARARAWRLSTMSFPSTTTRKHDSAKVLHMVLIFQMNHKVLLLFPFNISCWIPFVCIALVVLGCWWFLVGNNRTTEQTCESCCDKLAVGAHSAHKEETTQMQQLSKLLCSSRPLSLNSCAECSNTKQYLESWTLGPPG